MLKLINLWYRARVMKYRVLIMPVNKLQKKFERDPGSLTLTELGQLHYMGTELLTLIEIAKRAAKTDEEEPPKEESKESGGMYL